MNITMSQTGGSASAQAMPHAEEACAALAGQRVRLVEDFAGLSAQERLAWNTIADQQSVTVPFQPLYWNEIWWQHFGAAPRGQEKKLQIFIVEREGEIIGFFPMLRQCISMAGVPLLRFLQPLGSDNNLTELRAGIVREGCERDAYAALAGYLQGEDRGWDVVSLPAGPAEVSDLYEAISVEHPTIPLVEGFSIPLAADWDTFRSGLKRNIKESIRKCYNSFKRDGIEPEFTCLSDPADIRNMLPEFYRLHSTRAEQEGGNDHRDAFEGEEARQFIDLLAREASRSGLRLFLLYHGERLIAARLGFDTANGTYLSYSGYDLEYGKYSVMTRLVIEVIRRAIDLGKQNVHMSFGRDVSKTRWGPEEAIYTWRLMFRNSLRGRVASLVLKPLMRLKNQG